MWFCVILKLKGNFTLSKAIWPQSYPIPYRFTEPGCDTQWWAVLFTPGPSVTSYRLVEQHLFWSILDQQPHTQLRVGN